MDTIITTIPIINPLYHNYHYDYDDDNNTATIPIINLLYYNDSNDHNNHNDDMSIILTLLSDIDITTVSAHDIKETVQCFNSNKTINTHRDALSTFDKLMSPVTNAIINHNPTPTPTNTSSQIINHSLSNNKIIIAFTNNYKLVHNNAITDDHRDTLPRAILSGLLIKKLNINSYTAINDRYIASCTSITDLYASHNRIITTCNPFAKTLRILNAAYSSINDLGLKLCTAIEKLTIDGNEHITTCDPFAKSLTYLSALNNNTLHDKSIQSCTSIEKIRLSCNRNISTFEPFAKSLKLISIDKCPYIDNKTLEICTSITELYTFDYHDDITTCASFASFAKTLRILSAQYRYYGLFAHSITDESIKLCWNIEILYANGNMGITTCTPFAQNLRILEARGYCCGITDNGLRQCLSIKILDASDNHKITTCRPFARTLQTLRAKMGCGISNNGLRGCRSIILLYALGNNKITSGCGYKSYIRLDKNNAYEYTPIK